MSVFAFGGMFSSLLILLEGQYSFTPKDAAALVGTFMGLYYMLPLLGGYLGDKKISFSNLFIAGQIMQMLGSLVFLYGGNEYLAIAFACFLANAAVCSVAQNMFLNLLYTGDDDGRKRAYYWIYSAMNIGVIFSLIATGFFEVKNSYINFYIISFFLSLFTILISSALFEDMKFVFKQNQETRKSKFDNILGALSFLFLLLLPVTLIFAFAAIGKPLLLLLALLVITIKFYCAINSEKLHEYKNNFKKLINYMVCTMLFYCIYMLMPTFFFLFLKHDVDTIFWGFELPPQWIETIGALYVVVATPICAALLKWLKSKRGITISYALHFKLGIVFALCALLLFSLGLMNTIDGSQQALLWMGLNLFCLYTGEILLAPTSQAVIGELVPKSEQGFFTGTMSTILGSSVLISSYVSQEFWHCCKNLIVC